MKKTVYFFATILLVGGTIITGCRNSRENGTDYGQERVSEGADTPQTDYTVTVQEFRTETSQRISDNERRITELREEIAADKQELRRERNKARLAELEQTNMEMKKRIDEYQDKGKMEWEEFKREFNRDMDELGNALRDLTRDNEK